jgi:hypothetical protein
MMEVKSNLEADARFAGGGMVPVAVLAENWPALSTAMRQYEENTAEAFTVVAYDAIEQGVIRLDERRRLARLAGEMGIREFDGQLLIACAVRKWSMDHRYDESPSRDAPRLSYEYKAWVRGWVKFGIVAATAAVIDSILLWNWLR